MIAGATAGRPYTRCNAGGKGMRLRAPVGATCGRPGCRLREIYPSLTTSPRSASTSTRSPSRKILHAPAAPTTAGKRRSRA